MKAIYHQSVVLIFGLVLLLASCQSRYGQIPRSSSKGSNLKATRYFGSHFIADTKSAQAALSYSNLTHPDIGLSQMDTFPKLKKVETTLVTSESKKDNNNIIVGEHMEHITETDTLLTPALKSSDAAIAFGIVGGLNLLMVLVPTTVMVFILLTLVFAVSIFYLAGIFLKELKRMRLLDHDIFSNHPPNAGLLKLRKLGKGLFLVAMALFTISLILLVGSAFVASFVIATLGGITLFISVTCLVISLLANLV